VVVEQLARERLFRPRRRERFVFPLLASSKSISELLRRGHLPPRFEVRLVHLRRSRLLRLPRRVSSRLLLLLLHEETRLKLLAVVLEELVLLGEVVSDEFFLRRGGGGGGRVVLRRRRQLVVVVVVVVVRQRRRDAAASGADVDAAAHAILERADDVLVRGRVQNVLVSERRAVSSLPAPRLRLCLFLRRLLSLRLLDRRLRDDRRAHRVCGLVRVRVVPLRDVVDHARERAVHVQRLHDGRHLAKRAVRVVRGMRPVLVPRRARALALSDDGRTACEKRYVHGGSVS
jgi:hypothetical protein